MCVITALYALSTVVFHILLYKFLLLQLYLEPFDNLDDKGKDSLEQKCKNNVFYHTWYAQKWDIIRIENK